MKKLMMLLACGLMMAVAQAASVSWASGAGIKGPGGTYAAAGDVKMYVFALTAEQYNDMTAAKVAELDVSTALLSGATTKSTSGITLTNTTKYGAGSDIYAAVLLTVSEGGKDYYMAQTMKSTVNDLDGAVSFGSLAKKDYMSGTALTWTEASGGGVPEPTSGLLLLVGGAMLALRRRRQA